MTTSILLVRHTLKRCANSKWKKLQDVSLTPLFFKLRSQIDAEQTRFFEWQGPVYFQVTSSPTPFKEGSHVPFTLNLIWKTFEQRIDKEVFLFVDYEYRIRLLSSPDASQGLKRAKLTWLKKIERNIEKSVFSVSDLKYFIYIFLIRSRVNGPEVSMFHLKWTKEPKSRSYQESFAICVISHPKNSISTIYLTFQVNWILINLGSKFVYLDSNRIWIKNLMTCGLKHTNFDKYFVQHLLFEIPKREICVGLPWRGEGGKKLKLAAWRSFFSSYGSDFRNKRNRARISL